MNQDKIWDYLQNDSIQSFDGSHSRLNTLVKKFTQKEKVLNIGVGSGVFEKLSTAYGLEVYSLDPSEKSIDKIKSFLGDEKAKVGYSQSIPFESDYFDGVIMSEVLEHLDNEIIIKTLDEVRRVLKKGGKFIGTVPYKENLTEQIVICPQCGEVFHRWGHIQSFDIPRVSNLLATSFQNTQAETKMYISWNTLNWKGKFSAFFSYILFKLGLKENGLNIYFKGTK